MRRSLFRPRLADASFRSYFREYVNRLAVEDSRPTHEDPEEAYRIVSRLLAEVDDLVGIYIAGGGISGVLRALREAPNEKPNLSYDLRLNASDPGAARGRCNPDSFP